MVCLVISMDIYSDGILSEVRDRADIIEIISGYISLQKRGDSYVGLCPFHSEKTPSFHINPTKQLYYCFGCGAGGNVFTFLMKKENFTFPEALRWLADRYHVSIPTNRQDKGISRDFKERQRFFEVNQWAADFFHHSLLNTAEGETALKYLKARDVSDSTIQRFMLGYSDTSWDSLKAYATSRGISEEILSKLGLIIERKDNKGYYDRFRERLMFPILDTTGKVIGFGGRSLGNQEPKYLNSPETPIFSKGDNLYALPMIKKDISLDIILVEGYMDCLSLHQNGFTQAVATLGTALTKRQANLIKRYSDGVILAYDADDAGQRATVRGIKLLYDEGFSPRILTMPEGKDPDDFIRAYGPDAFNEQLSDAKDHVHYRWGLLKEGLDLGTPNGKIRFLKAAIAVLSGITREPEREIYIRDLASRLQVPVNMVRREVSQKQLATTGMQYKKSHKRDNNRENAKLQPLTGFYKAEANLLKTIIEEPEVLTNHSKDITPEMFLDGNTKKVADIVLNAFREGKRIAAADLFNHLDEKGGEELSRILMSEVSHKEDMAIELINHVKIGYLKHTIDGLRAKLHQAELEGRREEINNLLNTYQILKSEMDQLGRITTPGKGEAK